jgi:hypothetical protein
VNKHTDHPEKMEELALFIHNFFENMDDEYHDVKEAFEEELEDLTSEIDEEMIVAILDNLKKKDGTRVGIRWTKEEIDMFCHQYDIKGKMEALKKEYDHLMFWFAMNYVHAVHNNPNRTLNGYIDLAIDEIANKNICVKELIKKIFKKI